MGFPQLQKDIEASLCVCHNQPKYVGYYCPQCRSKLCELQVCPVCGLTLVSSPHLARTYHHLFPVPVFKTIENTAPKSNENIQKPNMKIKLSISKTDENKKTEKQQEKIEIIEKTEEDTKSCFACLHELDSFSAQCPNCKNKFCSICDDYIHDSLQNCPGCQLIE